MARYLIKRGRGRNSDDIYVPTRKGLPFTNEDIDKAVGTGWIIEQLESWLGKEYQMMSEHRYRWIMYQKGHSGTLNIEATAMAGHEIYGEAIICLNDEIDFDWIDIKGHTNDYREDYD